MGNLRSGDVDIIFIEISCMLFEAVLTRDCRVSVCICCTVLWVRLHSGNTAIVFLLSNANTQRVSEYTQRGLRTPSSSLGRTQRGLRTHGPSLKTRTGSMGTIGDP